MMFSLRSKNRVFLHSYLAVALAFFFPLSAATLSQASDTPIQRLATLQESLYEHTQNYSELVQHYQTYAPDRSAELVSYSETIGTFSNYVNSALSALQTLNSANVALATAQANLDAAPAQISASQEAAVVAQAVYDVALQNFNALAPNYQELTDARNTAQANYESTVTGGTIFENFANNQVNSSIQFLVGGVDPVTTQARNGIYIGSVWSGGEMSTPNLVLQWPTTNLRIVAPAPASQFSMMAGALNGNYFATAHFTDGTTENFDVLDSMNQGTNHVRTVNFTAPEGKSIQFINIPVWADYYALDNISFTTVSYDQTAYQTYLDAEAALTAATPAYTAALNVLQSATASLASANLTYTTLSSPSYLGQLESGRDYEVGVVATSNQQFEDAFALAFTARLEADAAYVAINPPKVLLAPANLQYTINQDSSVTLFWEPSRGLYTSVERYAIFWSSTNFASDGWAWAHDQTYVTIPAEVLSSSAGINKNIQFKVRGDDDTNAIYSQWSNTVDIYVPAPPVAAPLGIEVYPEGGNVTITAPQENQRINQVVAWYGDPNNGNCGAYVSSTISDAANGLYSYSFPVDNGYFNNDPCGGVPKVLVIQSVTFLTVMPPGPTPEEIAAEQEAARVAAEQAAQAAAVEAARLEAERVAAEAAATEAARIAAEQAAAAEAARIEAERLEAARTEAERIAAAERAERERLERLAAEAEAQRIEAERVAAAAAAEVARIEAERAAAESAAEAARLEAEKIAAEKAAVEAAAAAEVARLEAERLEAERVAAEKALAEAAAKAAAEEAARLEAEAKAEADRLEKERLEAEANKPTPSPTPTPEPTPTPSATPTTEPTPAPSPTPTPEPTKEPTPTEQPVVVEIKEPITAENITAVVAELATIAPQQLTQEQQTLITEAALQTFETATQGSPEYEAALDALLVVAQADDIVIDEELAAIPLIGNVAGAAIGALNALGNAGADMSPQVREDSEKVVIAAVIVGQIAMTATAAATSAAASAARTR